MKSVLNCGTVQRFNLQVHTFHKIFQFIWLVAVKLWITLYPAWLFYTLLIFEVSTFTSYRWRAYGKLGTQWTAYMLNNDFTMNPITTFFQSKNVPTKILFFLLNFSFFQILSIPQINKSKFIWAIYWTYFSYTLAEISEHIWNGYNTIHMKTRCMRYSDNKKRET